MPVVSSVVIWTAMPDTMISAHKIHRPLRFAKVIVLAAAIGASFSWLSCANNGGGMSGWQRGENAYPPGGTAPVVIALGNFRGNPQPTQRETELSVFLFGVEPEPALGLSKPRDLAVEDSQLLICDSGARAVFDADPNSARLTELRLGDGRGHPIAIDVAPNGDRLVADISTRSVVRYSAAGKPLVRYAREDGPFRPADCLCVGSDVWVTNVAAHQIDVFDGASGAFKRTIGARGAGNGQFGLPLGMARTPGGDICVVDSLNGRVQVLGADGTWRRNIGRAGNRAGCFGRPKDVAVGPDGVVFVVDAASQRVHAFDESGRLLITFGEPGSGAGRLAMPDGIAVSNRWNQEKSVLPSGFTPAYAIYVAEQLDRPGVRVYAWGGGIQNRISDAERAVPGARRGRTIVATVADPHWDPNQCNACHTTDAGKRLLPIQSDKVNDVCLKCHDGRKTHAEPHPIGRPANTKLVSTPADWPTVDNRLACLTCHDIQRHCDKSARRPAVNSAMLRFNEPEQPMALCMQCHKADDNWRISPHTQLDQSGHLKTDSCMFCHGSAPMQSAGATPSHPVELRTEPERVCLSCHTKHWDYFPEGHVEHPMPPQMLARIERKEPSLGNRLPLNRDRVMCFTCHNPHEPGIFAAGDPAASFATAKEDADVRLRMNRAQLCTACHPK